MRAPVSLGYLTPALDHVRAGPWSVSSANGQTLTANGVLQGWDYFTPVHVERELTVDLRAIRRDCGLPDASVISGVLAWNSSLTNVRGAASTEITEIPTTTLHLDLDPTCLGGTLTVHSRLVLARSHPGVSRLAPRRAGSILWSDEIRIVLEGEGQRFPLWPLDFVKGGVGGGRAESGWCLQGTTADLSSSGIGSLRLLLNSENPAVRNLLDAPESTSSARLQQFLHYDVVRQLVMAALHSEDLASGLEYEAGTLGDLLIRIASRVFAGRPLDSLRGEYRDWPGEFEAELQGRLRFLEQAP